MPALSYTVGFWSILHGLVNQQPDMASALCLNLAKCCQNRLECSIASTSGSLKWIGPSLSSEFTGNVYRWVRAGTKRVTDTGCGTCLAGVESEGAAVDRRFNMVLVFSRSTAVQVEVIPYTIGFDRVLGILDHHIPILDNRLIE